MIPEFIDFCKELFPSIDPYTKEQAKQAMKQFESIEGPVLCRPCGAFDLLQGDIFSEIPFFYTDENGEMKVIRRKAQLLSNTCDASRDELLLFAAVHPLSDIHDNDSMISNIVRNKRYSAFYLPDRILKDDYVDFELINSMSRETFLRLYQEQKVKRIASLTMVGYYMFICKLTVFFMRPEDTELNSDRYVPA